MLALMAKASARSRLAALKRPAANTRKRPAARMAADREEEMPSPAGASSPGVPAGMPPEQVFPEGEEAAMEDEDEVAAEGEEAEGTLAEPPMTDEEAAAIVGSQDDPVEPPEVAFRYPKRPSPRAPHSGSMPLQRLQAAIARLPRAL